MLNIKREDIAVNSHGHGVLALPWTKTSQQRGAQEMVTLTDPLVCRWLTEAAAQLQPQQLVLRRSTESFRMFFREALSALQLQPDLFRPYSIRKGGAAHFI